MAQVAGGGGGGAGAFTVTPAELHGAAGTLRAALAELDGAGSGAGSLGAGDFGSPELAAAVADFCDRAGAVAAAMNAVIDVTANNTDQAGSAYTTTDATAMPPS
jgi:hypothetical protein